LFQPGAEGRCEKVSLLVVMLDLDDLSDGPSPRRRQVETEMIAAAIGGERNPAAVPPGGSDALIACCRIAVELTLLLKSFQSRHSFGMSLSL
jgi:hypothetical protein